MARDLIKKLPKYYRSSGVMCELMSTDGAILDAVEQVIDDADAQCLIGTADTSLSRWEKIFGLPVSPGYSDERRREILLARKRGSGTGTVAHLKSVIAAFSNGEVDITEYPSQYKIEIKFVGTIGRPPYVDDVTAAIDEIIPAHIGYTIIYQYNTWGDISQFTWGGINRTWTAAAEEEIE